MFQHGWKREANCFNIRAVQQNRRNVEANVETVLHLIILITDLKKSSLRAAS